MPATGEMRALTVVFAIPKSSRILTRHEECAETGQQSIGAHQSHAQAFVSGGCAPANAFPSGKKKTGAQERRSGCIKCSGRSE
jgi:hypothetical protein